MNATFVVPSLFSVTEIALADGPLIDTNGAPRGGQVQSFSSTETLDE